MHSSPVATWPGSAAWMHAGWPYVVPTWYQWADGGYYIIPRARSAWAKYMANDGRVSMSIDSPVPRTSEFSPRQRECSKSQMSVGNGSTIANEMSLRYLGEEWTEILGADTQ